MRIAGVTFFLLLLLLAGALQPAGARRHAHAVRTRAAPAAEGSSLYSLRERRRIQAVLRLRLLEMREAGLERVRSVIERRLPVEALFDPIPGPAAPSREH
ncbi:MAG TPA: hypothetical protein VN905_11515 [Candidatus Binatia bacterium]|nr:hypothetical protein [Candidatus Binatia bacterium]